MKKIALLALVLLMMLSTFVGCSDNKATETKTGTTTETTKTKDTTETDDWTFISDKGELVIGITIYEPMNYNDKDGKLVGFDTEFAEAVCKKLGLKPKFVEINWDTKEVELDAKSIDCIWNGLTVTEDRKENMDFSKSYIKNKQVVVIKKSNSDKYKDVSSLKDANLVAEVSSAGEKAITDDKTLSKATYTAVAAQSNALLEVKAGTADAAVLDYVMAKSMVGDGTDYSDLMIVDGIELSVEEYAIGFRNDSTATAKFNEAIDALITDGTLNTIADKYKLTASLLSNQK